MSDKPTVLVIEDEPSLVKAYEQKLSRDYLLTIANSGKDGLDNALKNPPQLILLDIILPGEINGFDVLKELKRNPKTSHIPVIVLTNLPDQESSAKAELAQECLIKSNVSLTEIKNKIDMYLAAKES